MENVFRDYGRFENESNNQIICFNHAPIYCAKDPVCMNV